MVKTCAAGQGGWCGRSLTGQSPFLKRTSNTPTTWIFPNVKAILFVPNQKRFARILALPFTEDTGSQLQFPSRQRMTLLSSIGIKLIQFMWQVLEASMTPQQAYKVHPLPLPYHSQPVNTLQTHAEFPLSQSFLIAALWCSQCSACIINFWMPSNFHVKIDAKLNRKEPKRHGLSLN